MDDSSGIAQPHPDLTFGAGIAFKTYDTPHGELGELSGGGPTLMCRPALLRVPGGLQDRGGHRWGQVGRNRRNRDGVRRRFGLGSGEMARPHACGGGNESQRRHEQPDTDPPGGEVLETQPGGGRVASGEGAGHRRAGGISSGPGQASKIRFVCTSDTSLRAVNWSSTRRCSSPTPATATWMRKSS